MKKETKIYEFDPLIYPFKLWVAITSDFSSLVEKFYQGYDKSELNTSFIENHEAATYIVQQKGNNSYYGSLIATTNKKYFTAKLMAHEATHSARDFWNHMNENITGVEADAYLVGWIVECIEKVKLNKV